MSKSDIIVVIDYGRIVEKGTHEALFTKKCMSYKLYMAQYAGIKN